MTSSLPTITGTMAAREAGDRSSKRPRVRKPTFASVARQASKAGIPVASYAVDPDGRITVIVGQPDTTANNSNPWDEVLRREPH